MDVIENAVQWAVNIANDNTHGYSQVSRWGPDYDCSSLIVSAWQQAGVPVSDRGATFTGNMRSVFLSCGFDDVTDSVGLSTGYGMQRGDVLLNDAAHAAMFIGNGKVVHARSSEGNSISGDQSGNEVRCQSYWNYPWSIVMRYKGGAVSSGKNETSGSVAEENHKWNPALLRYSNAYRTDCVVLQALLNAHGFACGSADGFFGAKTQAAVNRAQKYYGIEVDGICGKQTWAKLLEMG